MIKVILIVQFKKGWKFIKEITGRIEIGNKYFKKDVIRKMNQNNILRKMARKMRRRLKVLKEKYVYKGMDRRQTFEYIYVNKVWGGESGSQDTKFYSGSGSHRESYVEPYCKMIKDFIAEKEITTVCDVGCGDFHVASGWLNESVIYEGVDIVQELVDYNNEKYGADHIHFSCRDIVEDILPKAQLCLVRQVLQHLSNDEVACFLNKIGQYGYIIITEHVTKKEFAKKYNIDKPHGWGIRVWKQSGLYLDEEPFNLKIKLLQEIPYGDKEGKEILTSVLITNE